MLPAVVLALGLVTATVALPVTPEVTTGVQGVTQTNAEVPVFQGEKTGFQGSTEFYPPKEQTVQQTVPVSKVENVPVVENTQVSHGENPVLLPIQPLSVVPVSQVGPVVRPVIVPAEAIAAGRVIIMSIEPITQRSFPEVVGVPEKQVPYQQNVQPGVYTPLQTQVLEPNQQSYYVKPTEKQTEQVQTTQGQLFKEQTGENYNPVPQVYNVQPVLTETGEKHVPYQVPVETGVLQHQVQKQGYQQTETVQGQETLPEYQHLYRPIAVENVEKHGSQQEYNTQQYALHQGQHQQVQPQNQFQNKPVEQVYNVQPVEQQVYNVQQGEQVHHVPVEKQGYVPTQTVETQQQQVQQIIEKQAPHQHQINEYVPVQVQPSEPFYQQQVYTSGQTEGQVPYQQVTRTQTGTQVPEQKSKTPEVESYHPVQQVENYAGQPPYNYGDKVPQIQQSNPTHSQYYSVQSSSVLSGQE